MASQLPAAGSYFSRDSVTVHTTPVPLADLVKFRAVPGITCVYDDGTIQVYSVEDATRQ
jgi:hypothetical protein